MSKDKLWTKRYGEEEKFRWLERVVAEEAAKRAEAEARGEYDQEISRAEADAFIAALESSTVHTPIKGRAEKAEQFIDAVKRFSVRYRVSADIYRGGSGVSAWLLFTAGPVSGRRRRELAALIASCDTLTWVASPKGMESWCELALILHFATHRLSANGREIAPLE